MPTLCTQTTTSAVKNDEENKHSRKGSSKTIKSSDTSINCGDRNNNANQTKNNHTENSKTLMLSETSVVFGVPVDSEEANGAESSRNPNPLPGYLANLRKNNMSSIDEEYAYVLRRDSSFVLPQISSEDKNGTKRSFRSPFIQRQVNYISTNGFELKNLYSLRRHNTTIDLAAPKSSSRRQTSNDQLPDFKSHPLVSARRDMRFGSRTQVNYSEACFSARERGYAAKGIDVSNMKGDPFKPDTLLRGLKSQEKVHTKDTTHVSNLQFNEHKVPNPSESSKGIGSSFLQNIVKDKHEAHRSTARTSRKLGHLISRNQMRTLITDMD